MRAFLAALIRPRPLLRCALPQQVVNRVLSDESTILEAKRVLRDALADQELRNSAKAALGVLWGLEVEAGLSLGRLGDIFAMGIYDTMGI